MALRGVRFAGRLFNILACACATMLIVSACVTERPGVFYDVHFRYLPPITICGVFARDIAARTGFQISNISARGGFYTNECSAFLIEKNQSSRLGVSMGTDVTRNLLFVDVWEGGFGKRPTARAIELGHTITEEIRARFPDADTTPGKRAQGIFAP